MERGFVAPGDVLVFEGPGSGYRPDASADWHLMLGDEVGSARDRRFPSGPVPSGVKVVRCAWSATARATRS